MATIDADSIPIPMPAPTPRVAPNRPAVRGKPKPRLLGVVDYSLIFNKLRQVFRLKSGPLRSAPA